MADYLASLHRLEDLLRGYCQTDASVEPVAVLIEKLQLAASTSSDFASDVEIALRSLLVKLISEMDAKTSFTEQAPAIKLIKLSINLSLEVDAMSSLPKVPFLLIEDLLESQTIQRAKAIWKIVEGWTDQLTNDVLFSKGT